VCFSYFFTCITATFSEHMKKYARFYKIKPRRFYRLFVALVVKSFITSKCKNDRRVGTFGTEGAP